MNQDEYERRKRALAEHHEAAMDLLRAAYRTELRALELVWSSSPENPAPVPSFPAGFERLPLAVPPLAPTIAPAPPPPSPPPRRKRSANGALREAVLEVLHRLPSIFERADLYALLDPAPERSSLYREVEELCADGVFAVEERGEGRRPTLFRRVLAPREESPAG